VALERVEARIPVGRAPSRLEQAEGSVAQAPGEIADGLPESRRERLEDVLRPAEKGGDVIILEEGDVGGAGVDEAVLVEGRSREEVPRALAAEEPREERLGAAAVLALGRVPLVVEI